MALKRVFLAHKILLRFIVKKCSTPHPSHMAVFQAVNAGPPVAKCNDHASTILVCLQSMGKLQDRRPMGAEVFRVHTHRGKGKAFGRLQEWNWNPTDCSSIPAAHQRISAQWMAEGWNPLQRVSPTLAILNLVDQFPEFPSQPWELKSKRLKVAKIGDCWAAGMLEGRTAACQEDFSSTLKPFVSGNVGSGLDCCNQTSFCSSRKWVICGQYR